MRTILYQIAEDEAGMTVEHFLRRKHAYSGRTLIKLKHYDEGIRLNDAHVRTIDLLSPGDRLEINFLDAPEHGVENFIRSNQPVEIVYQDSDLVIFNKPADMPCHQSCGHAADTLANVFASYCDRLGLDLMYRPLNRLDRDTTGAVVVAKNRYAAGITNRMSKRYEAILKGVLPEKSGRVDLPIRRELPEEMRRIVAEDGQRSVTQYQVMAEKNGYSLVDFQLETGRTHQIRVHMAYLGCPVLGDAFYGTADDAMSRQALHCKQVDLIQPVSGQKLQVLCPLPSDMQDLCRKLQLFPAQ